jgi:pimeloyl-ACP methyl ester carboxylesterase
MLFLSSQGYRCIAHDRRGHGRSSQPWAGNNMDTYAADLAELAAALDLKDAVHVGHSTGGGEALRYTVRHGKGRGVWKRVEGRSRSPATRLTRCGSRVGQNAVTHNTAFDVVGYNPWLEGSR